jgi:hypothetical protein
MRRCLLFLVALSLVLPASAQKKKNKTDVPMAVVAAQFVYITSMHGDVFDPRTTSEDRAALQKVENAMRAWGKYHVVYRPEEANLMLVVKPGSIAQARVGIDLGNPPLDPNYPGGRVGPPSGPLGAGTMAGVEASNSPDDMLLVSLSPQEPADNASFMWRRSARHGLQGQKPALVEAFRDAVDATARQNAKP